MKILLIYPNISKSLQEPMGLSYISAVLKRDGHEVFLWDYTFDKIDDLETLIIKNNFNYVCITALSSEFSFAVKLAELIKSLRGVPIIIGGPHVTFMPHEAILKDCFDVAVIGEGEDAIVEYVKSESRYIAGTWVKDYNTIYMNKNNSPSDITKLPWPDHAMFKRHLKRNVTWSGREENYGTFMTARGCPFKCAYCYAKGMQDLYKGYTYTRYREIEDVIAEIKYSVEKFNLKSLYFIDETLTTNKQRILQLCELYKEEIGLPWHCETRPNTVDEEVLQAMKDAGCEVVMMGLEASSNRVRNDIYNRNLSKEQIVTAFKLAKKVGLKTSSFNIAGGPTETKEEIRETIQLNKECEADIGKMTLFSVFPGSELWNYCKSNGYYIRDNYPTNYYTDSNLHHDTLSIKQLMELRKEFVDSLDGYTGSKIEGEY